MNEGVTFSQLSVEDTGKFFGKSERRESNPRHELGKLG